MYCSRQRGKCQNAARFRCAAKGTRSAFETRKPHHQKLAKIKELAGRADCPNQASLSKWLDKIDRMKWISRSFSWLWTYPQSQLVMHLEVILLGGLIVLQGFQCFVQTFTDSMWQLMRKSILHMQNLVFQKKGKEIRTSSDF